MCVVESESGLDLGHSSEGTLWDLLKKGANAKRNCFQFQQHCVWSPPTHRSRVGEALPSQQVACCSGETEHGHDLTARAVGGLAY